MEYTNAKGETRYLYKTTVRLRGGKKETIYYFSKRHEYANGERVYELPSGYEIRENPRTHIPNVYRLSGEFIS